MLITLDEKYEKSLIKNGLLEEELDFFIEQLKNMEKGKLFFLCNAFFYKYLVDNYKQVMSNKVVCLLNRLIDDDFVKISEAKVIKPLFTICGLDEQEEYKDGTYFINYKSFPENYIPYLCSENMADVDLYSHLFGVFTPYCGMTYFMKESCGGNDVSSVLKSFIEEERVFLYIGDSDKKFPNDEEGNTARGVRNVFDNYSAKYSAFYILCVHEKENLIPFKYYKKISNEIAKVVDYLLSLNSENYINYFDIKDGINKKDAFPNSEKSDDWKLFYNDVIEFIRREGLENKEEKSKKFFKGIGKDGLEKVVCDLNKDEINRLLTVTQQNDLRNISELMLKYGYCYSSVTN